MPIFKLEPYESQMIGYEINRRRFRFIVESDERVKVYVVERDEAMKFKSSHNFHSFYKTREKKYHEEDIRLPYSGDWYLIIYNPNSEMAAVSCDVY